MRANAAHGAVVLGYHDVTASPDPTSELNVTVEQLRNHIAWMRAWGYRFVTMAGLLDRLERDRPVERLAVVTFDDGLVGVHEHALPTLAALGVPATAFVVTDAPPGREPAFWPGARRTMTLDEMAACEAGGIELASHTRSHRSLPELPTAELRDELVGSREDLERRTGHPVTVLAYPSGHHNGRVRAVALAAGYRAAFTFVNGRVRASDDRYGLARMCMTSHHSRWRLRRHLARAADAWPVPRDVLAPAEPSRTRDTAPA